MTFFNLDMYRFCPWVWSLLLFCCQDLDLVRFIITCLTTYFPGILAYLLLFEMPWLLSCMSVITYLR